MPGLLQKGVLVIKKASLTVEAALIFPILFFAFIAFIYIIMWFQTAEKVQQELVNQARFISCAAYSADELITKIGNEPENDIHIEKNYKAGISIPIISLLPLRTHQKVYMRKFTGIDSLEEGEGSEIVYITPHGEVYHLLRSCTYIKAHIYSADYSDIEYKRNAAGQKYIPCSKCAGTHSEKVYITEYGIRYHSDKNCIYIEKNAIPVRLSEASDRRICSKCAKKGDGL